MHASAFLENERESWTGSKATLTESHIRLSKGNGYFAHLHLTVGPALNRNARFCSSQQCPHHCRLPDVAKTLANRSFYSEATGDLHQHPIYPYRAALRRLSPCCYSGMLYRVQTDNT